MKKIFRIIALTLSVVFLFGFSGCEGDYGDIIRFIESLESDILETVTEKPKIKYDDLAVHFIDVGQGDSALIELPNGKTMLIDAGEKAESDEVISYLNERHIENLDYVIGTHPHSDHIGGMADVIYEFPIGKMYMPKVAHNSKAFETMLDAVEAEGVDVYSAKAGVLIYEDEMTKIQIIAPCSDYYEELNDYSAVIRLDYGETSFLFMGDAEQLSENEITADVRADVLKVGHHGSKSSSSKNFLYRVMPEIAVISVGEGNDYGHPSKPVVKRLGEIGAKVLRTDEYGDIVIFSDGINVYEGVEINESHS